MIRHTVVFSLKHAPGSEEERVFMEKAMELTEIPTVQKFERLRQVSAKCEYSYGFSMEFTDQEAFDFYMEHPIHVRFVEDVWLKEVPRFQEIDYELL